MSIVESFNEWVGECVSESERVSERRSDRRVGVRKSVSEEVNVVVSQCIQSGSFRRFKVMLIVGPINPMNEHEVTIIKKAVSEGTSLLIIPELFSSGDSLTHSLGIQHVLTTIGVRATVVLKSRMDSVNYRDQRFELRRHFVFTDLSPDHSELRTERSNVFAFAQELTPNSRVVVIGSGALVSDSALHFNVGAQLVLDCLNYLSQGSELEHFYSIVDNALDFGDL